MTKLKRFLKDAFSGDVPEPIYRVGTIEAVPVPMPGMTSLEQVRRTRAEFLDCIDRTGNEIFSNVGA